MGWEFRSQAGLKGQWGTLCPSQSPELSHSLGTFRGEGAKLETTVQDSPESSVLRVRDSGNEDKLLASVSLVLR